METFSRLLHVLECLLIAAALGGLAYLGYELWFYLRTFRLSAGGTRPAGAPFDALC
jgi:hypothetical protein